VTGETYNQPILWAARDSSARKARVEPPWLPGVYIALEAYRPLDRPIPLNEIRASDLRFFL